VTVRAGLFREPGFRNLWLAQTVSLLGSQVTLVAFPLLALMLLHASVGQVSVLWAMGFIPVLLLGLPAGAWVERVRRRPVLITSNIVSGLATASIPVAYALHDLAILQVYLVAFVVGLGTLFFEVANLSYLPSLIREDQLTEGNARLEGAQSIAQLAGPSLGGILVEAVTAPVAIIADAASYALSAVLLLFIRDQERQPEPAKQHLRNEIREGLHFIATHAVLRPVCLCTATGNLAGAAILALQIVYAQRTLHLSPALIGIVLAVGNAGGLVGSLLAAPLSRRLTAGTMTVISAVIAAVGTALIPLGSGFAGLGLALFTFYVGVVIFNVVQVTVRQTLTPQGLLSRANATMLVIEYGTLPVGAIAAGVVATHVGVREALWFAAIVFGISIVPLLLSRSVRRLNITPDRTETDRDVIGSNERPITALEAEPQ
jgi:MFS family permease